MMNIRHEVSLLPYNTFGISATASVFAESDHVVELADFLRSCSKPYDALVLGGGSNILFVSDRCNTVVHPLMKGIELIDETNDDVLVRAGAGEIWDDFVSWCVENHYAGVENLSYIPGTVGACPIQNIGAYGAEAKDTIETVETIEKATGETITFNKQQCLFDYRDSFFKKNKGKYLITAVQFRLSKRFEPNVKYAGLEAELSDNADITPKTIRQAIITIRRRKFPNPAILGNAGSFFKNPTIDAQKAREITLLHPQAPLYSASQDYWKISAAWLIQQCGWTGKRDGHVGTHEWHPLIIVNYGGANGKDVLHFSRNIIESVNEKFGVDLQPEVNIV